MCRREVLAVSLMVRTVTRVRTAAIGLTANRLAGAGFTGSREAQHAAFGGLVGRLGRPESLDSPVDPEDLRYSRN